VKDPQIQSLIEAEDYIGALRLCEERLAEDNGSHADILRQRSHINALIGDYKSALLDRAEIINSNRPKLQDFFQAGNAALNLRRFNEAEIYFAQLIEKGQAAGEDWFASAAYFLTAYAQMRLGRIDDAAASLSRAEAVEPTCEIPIPNSDIWDIRRLRAEIHAASRRS